MITKFKLFEQVEQDWKLILDISTIWKESLYENNNELNLFNQQYINFLLENKNLILNKTSQEDWDNLENLINKLDENKDKLTESTSVWDDIYDWADSNFIQIKATEETKNDF